MAISSRYGSEWRDFFLNNFLFHLYSICCVIMGWRGVGGWVGVAQWCLGSFPPVHGVCAPNWPSACIQTCWHSRVCCRFGNTESEMNFDEQQEKKKQKTCRPIPLLQVLRYFIPFVYVTSFLGWSSSFWGKLLLSQKILQKWQLHFYGCTSLVHEQGCMIAEHCCLVPKLQLHHKGHP